MNKLTLPLEIDKKYVLRNGKVAEVIDTDSYIATMSIKCFHYNGANSLGPYVDTGQHLKSFKSPYDVVADYIEEKGNTMNNELETLGKKITELQDEYNKLLNKPKDTFKPKGNWYLSNIGKPWEGTGTATELIDNFHYYETEEQVVEAEKYLRTQRIIISYVLQKQGKLGGDSCVYKNSRKWMSVTHSSYSVLPLVTMNQNTAESLVEDLNSGYVVLD